MALIIDVETTGLPVRGKNPYYKNLEAYENCRIVQLSYLTIFLSINFRSIINSFSKYSDLRLSNERVESGTGTGAGRDSPDN